MDAHTETGRKIAPNEACTDLDELYAWHLAQHPELVAELIVARKWAELIPFAEAIARDAPEELAATDQARYRTLRKAVTEIRIRGLALNPQALRKLAGPLYEKQGQ